MKVIPSSVPSMFVVASLLITHGGVQAQVDGSSLALSLDSLLSIPISTSAKYGQTAREAAASTTVITGDEIQSHGYRTLADVLASVRGFYATSDRSHTSLGIRGFSPFAGDNNRFLVLLDGHALNENFLGAARIGTALGLDLAFIDRIEIVRGPGSALYGSNAMLAVVNIVTKTGRAVDGTHMSVEAGSYGLMRVAATFGREFESGLEVTATASWSDSKGPDLYFREYDAPQTNLGVAENLDWDRSSGFLARAGYRGLEIKAFATSRRKGTPTGVFGSTFNDPDASSRDRRLFTELSLDQALAADKNLFVRAYYDQASSELTFPNEQRGDVSGTTAGRWHGGEARLRWDAGAAHRLTLGVEYRRDVEAELHGRNPVFQFAEGDFPSNVASGYVQVELQLRDNLALTAGLRADDYSTVGRAFTPRGALVYHPARSATLKILYGEAFRAPNQPELNVEALPFIKRNPNIEPERIRTTELVWEQRLAPGLFGSLAVYDYRMTKLIGATRDPADSVLVFRNFRRVDAHGLELGLTAHLSGDLTGRLGYVLQRSDNRERKTERVNSPRHSVRATLTAPLRAGMVAAFDLRYDSGRRTLNGQPPTHGYLVTDLALSGRPLGEHVRLSLAVKNLFDIDYAHPAGPGLLQREIPQDGRTLRFRLDVLY